jgi:hypothetical protein
LDETNPAGKYSRNTFNCGAAVTVGGRKMLTVNFIDGLGLISAGHLTGRKHKPGALIPGISAAMATQ